MDINSKCNSCSRYSNICFLFVCIEYDYTIFYQPTGNNNDNNNNNNDSNINNNGFDHESHDHLLSELTTLHVVYCKIVALVGVISIIIWVLFATKLFGLMMSQRESTHFYVGCMRTPSVYSGNGNDVIIIAAELMIMVMSTVIVVIHDQQYQMLV